MSFIVLVIGCATVPTTTPVQRKTHINQAIWSETTKDKVYTACVTALHMEGFGIYPAATSKESGIIVPKSVIVRENKAVKSYYKLQILVTDVQDNRVMVDVKIKGEGTVMHDYQKAFVRNEVDNRIAEDMEKLFTRLDIFLGKADYYRDDGLYKW